jgi:hypothetical protein
MKNKTGHPGVGSRRWFRLSGITGLHLKKFNADQILVLLILGAVLLGVTVFRTFLW